MTRERDTYAYEFGLSESKYDLLFFGFYIKVDVCISWLRTGLRSVQIRPAKRTGFDCSSKAVNDI